MQPFLTLSRLDVNRVKAKATEFAAKLGKGQEQESDDDAEGDNESAEGDNEQAEGDNDAAEDDEEMESESD